MEALKGIFLRALINYQQVEDLHSEATAQQLEDLLNNSRYSDGSDIQNAPKTIQDFAKDCEVLHDHISRHRKRKEKNKIEKIKEILNKYPNSRYFYNTNNVSAAYKAAAMKKFDIYELLVENQVCIGPHEDVDEIFSVLKECKQERLKEIHDKYSKELPEQHLAVLIANTRLCHAEHDEAAKQQYVKDAYKILNKIPQTKILLEVVAAVKNFAVTLDFQRTSVQHMAPDNGPETNGVFYFSKQVYVAAKEFLDLLVKLKAVGVLGHELCHFAMFLVFGNWSIPFPLGDAATEEKFKKILDQCKANKDKEEIIKNVFDCYEAEVQLAELIVRVPQMSATYHGDKQKLKQVREDFKGLFEFYEKKVMKQMEKALPMIKKLAENPDEVQWKDLTPEMQMTIENSKKINFQGVKTTLKQFNVRNKSEIYEKLTSKDICEIMKGNEIEIGRKIDTGMKFYVERKFSWAANKNWPWASVFFFKDLAESNLDVILLSDAPGAGKSSTFKNCALKMQEIYSKNWISYIDLKQHTNIYEKWNKDTKEDDWTMEKLKKFFVEILKLNSFEAEILRELLNSSKMFVIFWDGLDEISPKFNEFMIKFIKSARNKLLCQQWISTRTHQQKDLEEKLEIKAHKLCPFTDDNKIEFLNKFASANELNQVKRRKLLEDVQDLQITFQSTDVDDDKTSDLKKINIVNPLFLQMLAEVQISLNSNQSLTSMNLSSLFEKFINMKLKIDEGKGFCAQIDRNEITLKAPDLMEIQQYYALKNIIPYEFKNSTNFNNDISLSSLQLMKKRSILSHDLFKALLSVLFLTILAFFFTLIEIMIMIKINK